jgi:type IV fimbrial biogenesis protein FimT
VFRLSSSPLTRAPRLARGFTIQETLISLCISGFLTVGGASTWDILQESTKTAAANDLVAHLALARSEAVKRHTRVKVCPSADQRNCADAGTDYTHWQNGWLVYADENHNGKPEADEILRVYAGTSRNLAIRTSRGREQVTYQPTGTSGGSNMTFAFCDSRGPKFARYVTINNGGRARVSRVSDSEVRCA